MCVVVRDSQLRPFDFVHDNEEEDDVASLQDVEQKGSDSEEQTDLMGIMSGMDTQMQVKIIEIKLEQINQKIK